MAGGEAPRARPVQSERHHRVLAESSVQIWAGAVSQYSYQLKVSLIPFFFLYLERILVQEEKIIVDFCQDIAEMWKD